MKYSIQSLALASIASARVLHNRESSCCFGIDVSGNDVQGGSLGQLEDGQNRFGPNQSGATYCIQNGQITDKSGRGCVVTGPTSQWQCDQGASPTGGFSLASSGQLNFNGNGSFYACPVDDNGNYNIYTKPVSGMPKCVQVSLNSSGGKCAAPSSSAVPSSTAPAVSVSTASCEASTVVKTVTQQNNVTVPVTQWKTQIQTQLSEKTDTAYQTEVQTKPTTIYQTQTQYQTINETKTVPTTIYKTEEETTTLVRTQEITETQTAPPVTEEVTQKTTATQIETTPNTKVQEETTTATQHETEKFTQVQSTTVVQPTTVEESTTLVQPTTIEESTTIRQPVTETQTTSVQQPPVTETTSVQQPPVTEKVTTTATSSASATPSSSGCPRDLPAMSDYQAPHLIIPVNSNAPDTAYGTQYNAYIGNGNSTIFNFDIPANFTGKTCELVFTFPKQSQLETSFVSSSGSGGIDFKQLKEPVTEKTTFNNQPGVAKDFGVKDVQEGQAYSITTGQCQPGQSISYELTATGDRVISAFVDYNPCPNGLWIIAS